MNSPFTREEQMFARNVARVAESVENLNSTMVKIQNVLESIDRGLNPRYRIRIIDSTVDLPSEIDIRYRTIDSAYNALVDFVHKYDGQQQVDGAVYDEYDDEDVDFVSSVL